MKRFTRLYTALDNTNSTNEKVRLLRQYVEETPAEDAAWGISFLMGNRLPRAVNSTQLRLWAGELAGLPPWMVEECYHRVGDLAETIALILPEGTPGELPTLNAFVTENLIPLRKMPEPDRKAALWALWKSMNQDERFVWNKLITGSFRVGVSKTLVVKALAAHYEVEQAVMAHRVMGEWIPSAEFIASLADQSLMEENPARPYPFFLANPITEDVMIRENALDFQAEWKWDGIRSQLIRRAGQTILWSRGEDLLTDRFPEISSLGEALPDGTVLDGEILAWENERPAPFLTLQSRITRKAVTPKILAKFPAVFMAYDIMEYAGEDVRGKPLTERRTLLEGISESMVAQEAYQLSPLVEGATWNELARQREDSRKIRTEGLMLKRHTSPYQSGRPRGDWWKWKVDPYTIDAVLTYAQPGHGRRAGLYTDYTFGLWSGDELVTVAKAYSGLTDNEILEVDSWIRKHITDKFGPVRQVKPDLVFELAFEGIQENPRKKSGLAVRFPRIHRWRKDKKAADADSLDSLVALMKAAQP